MTQGLWINLPVKELGKSKEFFKAMGFKFNEQFGGDSKESACLEVGEKPSVIMLFADSTFENLAGNQIADTQIGTEVLLSIDARSRQEVDEMASKAETAGGTTYAAPSEIDGWMYGCGFTDLDGHRWNVLYMDMDKIPNR